MRCNNPGDVQLAEMVRDAAPDVAVLNGLSRRSRQLVIEQLTELYPSSAYTQMPGSFECGTMVLSRYPMDTRLDAQVHPTAVVQTPALTFALVVADLPTPTRGMEAWLEDFDQLIADIPMLGDTPVVAIGDFNAVLEHEPMRRLMRETGLKDAVASSGFGWMPTFPDGGFGPPRVALDHALVSPGLVATQAWTASIEGQDHRAFFVTVGVAEYRSRREPHQR